MDNERFNDFDLDCLDRELSRAEQAQLQQWETRDLGGRDLPFLASRIGMRTRPVGGDGQRSSRRSYARIPTVGSMG
jgi:hypothetical protein